MTKTIITERAGFEDLVIDNRQPGLNAISTVKISYATTSFLFSKVEYSDSILRNTVRNISNILGYSGIFARNISVILIVFCAEYVGIRYTTYSEAEYCWNTTSANNLYILLNIRLIK